MKKTILVYGTLACSVVALVMTTLSIREHSALDRDMGRGRPRSIRERMLEERQSTAFTGLLSQERTTRGDDGDEGSARDAFDKWFYEQRKYPADSLPVGAIEQANLHADNKNFDERAENVGPRWSPLGPDTIPDGQTDGSAGQLSPV